MCWFRADNIWKPLLKSETDPILVNKLKADPAHYKNCCTHCNRCAALIKDASGVRWVKLHPESSSV